MRELTEKEKEDWVTRSAEWAELERVNSLKNRSFNDISVRSKILILAFFIFQILFLLYIFYTANDLSTVKIIVAIGLTIFYNLTAALNFKYRLWNKFLYYLNGYRLKQTKSFN